MPRQKRNLALAQKPRLGVPDALEAAQEVARNMQEGNHKLGQAVTVLRQALETIVHAEVDNHTGLPVSAKDLRMLAKASLDAYSQISGQSWRRNPLIGDRSGDRNMETLSQ
jgi:hypothetical protein